MAYPENSYELVTLAEVKSMGNLNNTFWNNVSDSFISSNIGPICRSVEKYCRRRFLKKNWVQWVQMESEVMTDNWPINNVLLLGVPYTAATITDSSNNISFNITQETSFNPEVESKLTLTNVSSLVTTDYAFSTYTTLGSLKAAVEANVASVSFTYQPVQSSSTIDFSTINTLALRPTTGKTIYAGVNYFNQTSTTSLGDVYRLSANSDRLYFNPTYVTSIKNKYSMNFSGAYSTGFNNIDSGYSFETYNENDLLLIYNSGYTTSQVPQELKFVVVSIFMDLINLYNMYENGIYRGALKSESLGDYSYTLGDKFHIYDLVDKYRDMLDPFIKKVI